MDAEELRPAHLEVEHHRRPSALERVAPEAAREGSDPLRRLASTVGNGAFGQFVARMREGEGILDGGVVHPDVEGAIAAARGHGRALDLGLAQRAGSQFGDSFGDVRVHTDSHAAELSRAVSARAFTVGSDIFFAAGEYNPGSAHGDELIAHELAHVVQQRGAPPTGALVVSQPGDALEREAEAAARGF